MRSSNDGHLKPKKEASASASKVRAKLAGLMSCFKRKPERNPDISIAQSDTTLVTTKSKFSLIKDTGLSNRNFIPETDHWY